MANLGITIEASTSSMDYDVLPEGWYEARVTSAEVRETKAGTGSYISLRYDVTGPSHEGRVVFGNLNLSNPNSRAEQIGREQLAQLVAALGLKGISDSDELIGGECQIKVRIKTDDYGTKNEIRGWKSLEGSPLPAPTKSTPASEGKPPWAK